MKGETGINEKIRRTNIKMLKQDIGLLIFLAGILGTTFLLSKSSGTEYMENLVMLLILYGEVILAAYKFKNIAIVLGGTQTCFYSVYKIYQGALEGQTISYYSFAWLVLPMTCILAMIWFTNVTYETEIITEMLEKQIEERTLTDRITGLYNLKSMYMDLERQMAFCKRNNLPLSLMIVELRYEQELRSILSASQYEDMLRIYAEILEDSIRLEDRIYAIDEKGGIGIICTCNKPGAQIMNKRIVMNLSDPDKFRDLLGKGIRIEIKTGIFEYDSSVITNSIDFKKKAENELQYDV